MRPATPAMPGKFAAIAALAACTSVPACSGPRELVSRDFELLYEVPGEGRPAITALAFVDDGAALAVGDYRGGIERTRRVGETFERTPEAPAAGEILALVERGGALVPVLRSGEPFGWGRLTGALAASETGDGRCVGWSTLTRRLAISASGFDRSLDARVTAVAVAGERLCSIEGRTPGAMQLACRDLPTLAERWRVDLERPAHALAVIGPANRIVVTDDSGLEVRDLEDGRRIHRISAPPSIPHSLRDGTRALLVQSDDLAVLELGDPPRIYPAFLAHRGGVTAVAVAPDGTLLATGGARGDVLVFRVLPVPAPGASP